MVIAEVAPREDLLRDKVKDAVKKHKASWIQLGQYLYSIHKDKLYRSWGFLTFEAYCVKELRLKQATAAKLLKSYYFLEKEEPQLARPEMAEEGGPQVVPSYESVNLLRLARENKNLTPRDFAEIRTSVIEKGKDAKEVKAQVKQLIEQSAPKDSPEAEKSNRNRVLRRTVTLLTSTRRELEKEKWVPGYVLKQMADVIQKLQDQIEA